MKSRRVPDQQNKPDCFGGSLGGWLCLVFGVLAFLWAAAALAQEVASSPDADRPVSVKPMEVVAAVVVRLPQSHQLAASLATREKRQKVLLDVAAAQHVLERAKQDPATTSEALARQFRQDRGWLTRLVNRYGWTQPHSGILDAAAWSLSEELRDLGLPVMALVRPDSIPLDVTVFQVFQRSNERLASANLPILLYHIEHKAVAVWDGFMQLVSTEGEAAVQWQSVEAEWFPDRDPVPATLVPDDSRLSVPSPSQPLQMLSRLAANSVAAGPPDARGLQKLREHLLVTIPDRDKAGTREGSDLLHLATMIDGLQDGKYFEFVRDLLAITAGLAGETAPAADERDLVSWLVGELPAISAHYSRAFARVDPRLNAAMAGSYKVLTGISKPDAAPVNITPGKELANVVAQLALMIPDMGFYFDTPVRVRIADKITACTRMAASRDEQGFFDMSRSQFDGCIDGFLQLAETQIRTAELAGSVTGPFRQDSLLRELNVTPDQRINYHIGYLHSHFPNNCALPATAMANPLEWALLATTMVWFAEYSPEFFNTPEHESRLARMRAIGEQLTQELAHQAACFSGDNLNDPVTRLMVDYETALRQLDIGIAAAESDFRRQNLRPGADVELKKSATQTTSYRPDDLTIGPCNPNKVCEMTGNLSATRALIGLFPDEYLLAEQTGMGKIEICYRNMEWVDRRSELVRPDDDNVANYFGHLAFDLVGRYTENEDTQDLFGFRFTSPQEQHYLFAQASDEVLLDSCPTKWVGTRIITPLRADRGGIVPDRLTYLAASRALPSRLLQSNWDRGAEWRDWFVTGIGVSALEMPQSPDIRTSLEQHMQALYQREQAGIYQRVLQPNVRNTDGKQVSLYTEMSQISLNKALMRIQMMLFYPQSLLSSDAIRQAIAGDAGLLERRTLRRFKEDNVALTSVSVISKRRLARLRKVWQSQPDAVRREGTMDISLMHAMTRINSTYRQFFTTAPVPLQQP